MAGVTPRPPWALCLLPLLPALQCQSCAVTSLTCRQFQKFKIFQSKVFVALNCFALANIVILGAACLHPWARHVWPSSGKHLARPHPLPLFPHLRSQGAGLSPQGHGEDGVVNICLVLWR